MAKKIMIVEDDPFLRMALSKKLSDEKFEIIPAVDGEEAVKKIKEVKPDLILLDLILPGIQGYEVLKEIRVDAKTKTVPVLVLSNQGQQEEIDRCTKEGISDFMIKANFTPDEIIAKIKGIVK